MMCLGAGEAVGGFGGKGEWKAFGEFVAKKSGIGRIGVEEK